MVEDSDGQSSPDRRPAFVIGLPDSFRGAPLLPQLEEIGLDPIRQGGVRTALIRAPRSSYYDADEARVLMRRAMTDGEIGCALAHRGVYARMIDDRLRTAWVFEDDARLVHAIDVDRVEALLDSPLPRVVTFYSAPGYLIHFPERRHAQDYRRAAIPPTTTTAYALNLSAARLLFDASTPVSSVADWPPAAAARIEFFCPDPLPVRPLPDSSNLEHGRNEATSGNLRGRQAVQRRAAALAHLLWVAHRQTYRTWPTYAQHELLRMPSYSVALRRGSEAPTSLHDLPRPLAFAIRAVYKLSHYRSARVKRQPVR